MPTAATVTIRLDGDSARLVRELKKAERASRSTWRRMSRDAKVLATRVGIIGTAAVGAFAALTRASLKSADQLAKTADKLGLTTEALAGLRLAAEQTGVKVTQLDLGLQRMTRRIAEAAQSTGEAQGALKELGIDAAAVSRLPVDEQFKAIADAMSGVTSQSDRIRLGFKLFDSEGVNLINTLAEGRQGLDEFRRTAEELNLTVSRFDASKIEAANDSVNLAKNAFIGLGNTFAVAVSPAIVAAGNAFVDAAREANGFKREVDIVVDGAVNVLGFLLNAWNGITLQVKAAQIGVAVFGGLVVQAINLGLRVLEPFSDLLTTAVKGWVLLAQFGTEKLGFNVDAAALGRAVEFIEGLERGYESLIAESQEEANNLAGFALQLGQELADGLNADVPSRKLKRALREARAEMEAASAAARASFESIADADATVELESNVAEVAAGLNTLNVQDREARVTLRDNLEQLQQRLDDFVLPSRRAEFTIDSNIAALSAALDDLDFVDRSVALTVSDNINDVLERAEELLSIDGKEIPVSVQSNIDAVRESFEAFVVGDQTAFIELRSNLEAVAQSFAEFIPQDKAADFDISSNLGAIIEQFVEFEPVDKQASVALDSNLEALELQLAAFDPEDREALVTIESNVREIQALFERFEPADREVALAMQTNLGAVIEQLETFDPQDKTAALVLESNLGAVVEDFAEFRPIDKRAALTIATNLPEIIAAAENFEPTDREAVFRLRDNIAAVAEVYSEFLPDDRDAAFTISSNLDELNEQLTAFDPSDKQAALQIASNLGDLIEQYAEFSPTDREALFTIQSNLDVLQDQLDGFDPGDKEAALMVKSNLAELIGEFAEFVPADIVSSFTILSNLEVVQEQLSEFDPEDRQARVDLITNVQEVIGQLARLDVTSLTKRITVESNVAQIGAQIEQVFALEGFEVPATIQTNLDDVAQAFADFDPDDKQSAFTLTSNLAELEGRFLAFQPEDRTVQLEVISNIRDTIELVDQLVLLDQDAEARVSTNAPEVLAEFRRIRDELKIPVRVPFTVPEIAADLSKQFQNRIQLERDSNEEIRRLALEGETQLSTDLLRIIEQRAVALAEAKQREAAIAAESSGAQNQFDFEKAVSAERVRLANQTTDQLLAAAQRVAQGEPVGIPTKDPEIIRTETEEAVQAQLDAFQLGNAQRIEQNRLLQETLFADEETAGQRLADLAAEQARQRVLREFEARNAAFDETGQLINPEDQAAFEQQVQEQQLQLFQDFLRRRLSLETDFARRFNAIQQGLTSLFGKQWVDANKKATAAFSTFAAAATSIGQSLFADNKALALGTATINTAVAITSALKTEPFFPTGLAMAAVAAAQGAAQIAAIQSASAGGGVTPSVSTSGATAGGAPSPSAAPEIPEVESQASVQLIIQGNVIGTDAETEQWLVDTLRRATDDRDVVVISGNSRQAAEIREG